MMGGQSLWINEGLVVRLRHMWVKDREWLLVRIRHDLSMVIMTLYRYS